MSEQPDIIKTTLEHVLREWRRRGGADELRLGMVLLLWRDSTHEPDVLINEEVPSFSLRFRPTPELRERLDTATQEGGRVEVRTSDVAVVESVELSEKGKGNSYVLLLPGAEKTWWAAWDFTELQEARKDSGVQPGAPSFSPDDAGTLKVCAAEDCTNSFVDTSPKQNRLYCSDRCKIRIQRRRQRAREKNRVIP
jgi:predicted RNA-binding Zn ribbon-like protein